MKRRKKTSERKSFTFNLRLTREDRTRLVTLAKEWGVPGATCVRILITRQSETERRLRADVERLAAMHNDLAGLVAVSCEQLRSLDQRTRGELKRAMESGSITRVVNDLQFKSAGLPTLTEQLRQEDEGNS